VGDCARKNKQYDEEETYKEKVGSTNFLFFTFPFIFTSITRCFYTRLIFVVVDCTSKQRLPVGLIRVFWNKRPVQVFFREYFLSQLEQHRLAQVDDAG